MVSKYYHTLPPEQAHLSLSSFATKSPDFTEHLSIKQANLQNVFIANVPQRAPCTGRQAAFLDSFPSVFYPWKLGFDSRRWPLSAGLCKDLSLSFPRTASDLDASTKGWSLTKVWNKPLAHMESSYWNKSSHRNQRCSPISSLMSFYHNS